MTQTQRAEGVATTISAGRWGQTVITYHSTQVVIFSDTHIALQSGGWRTATTKTRMNQASNQFNLGYQVIQRDFEWFVEFGDKTIPFSDGMVLNRVEVVLERQG